jgi:glutathione S-transferase
VQTLRPIAEELDRIHPHPPLLPSDPALRLVVEEADQFGFDALQTPLGRILWNALHRDHSSLRSYSQGARLGLPISIALLMAGPVAAAQARLWKAGDATVRNDLAALPEVLNQIDAWCEAGVLNGEQLNLADFRFAPSLRLAMTADDLRPLIAGRPAGDLAMRVVPNYPGRMPPILPPAWLEPLRGEAKPAPAI